MNPRSLAARNRRRVTVLQCRHGVLQAGAEPVGRRRAERSRGIGDGPVPRAAAEVAVEGTRIAGADPSRAVVLRHQAHDEAGRAIAALRSASGREGLLRRRQAIVVCKRLDGVDFAAGGHRQQHQAAVDRAVLAACLVRTVRTGSPRHRRRTPPRRSLPWHPSGRAIAGSRAASCRPTPRGRGRPVRSARTRT